MGARTLRGYVEQPLIDAEEINLRLEAVEELTQKPMLRDEIREYLNPIYDQMCIRDRNLSVTAEG